VHACCLGQAQIDRPWVSRDRNDADSELPQADAEPQPDLAQPDHDDMIPRRDCACSDAARREQPVDYPGGEHGGEYDRREHAGAGEHQGRTGTLVTRIRPAPVGEFVYRPWMRTASSLNHRRNSAPYTTSDLLSGSAFPISRVISMARSAARSSTSSQAVRRMIDR